MTAESPDTARAGSSDASLSSGQAVQGTSNAGSSKQLRMKRVLLGDTIKVRAYRMNGVTVRANVYSAPWRRMWWLEDFGDSSAVRRSLIESAGADPESEIYWLPRISFPSLRAACSAVIKATGAAS